VRPGWVADRPLSPIRNLRLRDDRRLVTVVLYATGGCV
jgi:hypothetical protein